MRPLNLTLEGFRSFAGATEIDWRERSLVGIVGPIGSGKSSILDGICFALYGKTPGERSNIRSLIHQRSDVGKVELVFSVEGQVWKAIRAIRRKGQSQHALYRLEDDRADAEVVEEILGKAEVDARLVDLLGLDFEGFNRSVLLAQGRFAEFLSATATDRDKVLKGVFGLDRLDRMEVVAKSRRDAATRDIDELGRRKADLETARQLADQTAERLEAATARHAELQQVAGDMAEIAARLAAAGAEATRAAAATEGLLGLADQMPDADTSRATLAAADTAAKMVGDASKELEEATGVHAAAAAELDGILGSVGGKDGLAESRRLATQREEKVAARERDQIRRESAGHELDEARLAVAGATSVAEERAVAHDNASRALEEARTDLETARREYDQAVHSDMAAGLRTGLEPGDPCPVCHQTIDEVPDVSTELDPAALKEQLSKVERTVAEAADRMTETIAAVAGGAADLSAAEQRVLAAQTRLDTSDGALESATSAVETIDVRLAELLGKEPLVRLASVEEALATAEEHLAATAAAKAAAETDLDRARQAETATRAAVASLSARVATLAGRLDVDVGTGETDVGVMLTGVRAAWIAAQQEAATIAEGAGREMQAAAQDRAVLLETVNLKEADSYDDALGSARMAVERLTAELETRREIIASAADLDEKVQAMTARFALYDQLCRDLRPSAFLGYLLEEERAELAAVGSARFEELSGGRYRFSEDGGFDVVDLTAAEGVRKSDTLSGGETFLASLALALGLAEMVARGKGRLDAFFLDEGFGSLDTEHLELAMAGIEQLVVGTDDRLVVVVSHVAEMQQRLEDLIRLDKDPVTGVTLIR